MKNLKDNRRNIIVNILKIACSTLTAMVMLSCANRRETVEETVTDTGTETVIKKSIHYLALGDSYTIGEGVDDTLRWPNQLGEKLRAINYEVTVDIIAQTGWTTHNLLQSIENVETETYNLVSLLIGVNNQYQKKAFTLFETEFSSLLNKSIAFAGDVDKVFVVSIPDYGVTPFGSSNSATIQKELDNYNAYMKLAIPRFF